MISFVWAQDKNGVIGKDNVLPWRLPNDLKWFKKNTIDSTIVMGRKTLESMNNRPLPNRTNVILSKTMDQPEDGSYQVVKSVEEILALAKDRDVNVIGGSQVFKALMDDVDRLVVTMLDEEFEGDTLMPEIDYSLFDLVEEIPGIVDEKNKHPHTFYIYQRKDG